MRYFISSNFKNLSMNFEKYVFHWGKLDFAPIMNSAHAFGCLRQEGGRLLIFRFFPTPLHLIKAPTFINFSKRFQKSTFRSIKDRRQYLSRVLPILAVVWKDVIALYWMFTTFAYFYTCFFSTVIVADRTFNLAESGKYTLEEKDAVGKLCESRSCNMMKNSTWVLLSKFPTPLLNKTPSLIFQKIFPLPDPSCTKHPRVWQNFWP